MKQVKIFQLVSLLMLTLFYSFDSWSQCGSCTYNITKVDGECDSDGQIVVTKTSGGAECNGTVGIRLAGAGGDSEVDNITGTTTFDDLPPGNYEVRVYAGAGNCNMVPITVSTSYIPMVLGAPTFTKTTCRPDEPLYTGDGTLTANINSGNGPYTYELYDTPGGTLLATFGPTSNTSHTFTDLDDGNYYINIKNNPAAGCEVEQGVNFSIDEQTRPTLTGPLYSYTQVDCDQWRVRLRMQNGNLPGLQTPGNAVVTGTNFPSPNAVYFPPVGAYNHTLGAPNVSGGNRDWTELTLTEGSSINLEITDGCREIDHSTNVPNYGKCFTATGIPGCPVGSGSDCPGGGGGPPPPAFLNFQLCGGANRYWTDNNVKIEIRNPDMSWSPFQDLGSVAEMHSGGLVEHPMPCSGTEFVFYRLIVSDDCKADTVEFNIPPDPPSGSGDDWNIGVSNAFFLEAQSVLEGTVGFQWSANASGTGAGASWSPVADDMNWPVEITLTRVDGQTEVEVNAPGPHSLARTYIVEFPLTVVFNEIPVETGGNVKFHHVGDLPPGNYNLSVQNACAVPFDTVISLNNPVVYDPLVEVVPGCTFNTVRVAMNEENTPNKARRIRLALEDDGEPGATYSSALGMHPSGLPYAGNKVIEQWVTITKPSPPPHTFTNILYGDYCVEFETVNFRDVNGTNSLACNIGPGSLGHTVYSAATNNCVGAINRDYHACFNIANLEEPSIVNTPMNCGGDDNVLAIEVDGEPIGFIRYEIWAPGDDPGVDAPIYFYEDNTAPYETSHVVPDLDPGIYSVRVTNQCGSTLTTVNVTGNPPAIPDVDLSSTTVCQGDNLVNATVNIPVSLFDFEWRDGSGSLISDTEISVQLTPTQTTEYTFRFRPKPLFLCPDNEWTVVPFTVTVINNDFIGAIENVICHDGNNGSLIMSNHDIISQFADSVVLTAPDGQTTTYTNPNDYESFENLGAGQWTLVVYIESGCDITRTFNVTQPNAIAVVFNEQDPSCDQMVTWDGGSNAQITGGTTPYNITWYLEDTGTSPIGTNAQITNLAPGFYILVIEDDNGCLHQDTLNLVGPAPITFSSHIDPILCPGDATGSISISNIMNTQGDVNITWAPDGDSGNSIENKPAGNYTVTVSDENGCLGTFDFEIPEPPEVRLINTSVFASDCFGDGSGNGQVSTQATGGWTGNFTFYWYSVDDPSMNSNNPTWGVRPPGDYVVVATDDNGCEVSDTFTVEVVPVVADITVDPETGVEPLTVNFGNNSSTGENYYYIVDFGNGNTVITEDPDTLLNQVYYEGDYRIMIVAANGLGCFDTSYVEISVIKPLRVVAPNVFTPNGDGANDFFTFKIQGVAEFKCVIFDRWGKEVREITDYIKGWDGKRTNGKDAPDGVYFYIYDVLGDDGTEVSGQGKVTLLRDDE